MKKTGFFRKLPIIAAVLAILAGGTLTFAQDNGNDKDQGKHKGQYKRHTNNGLHLGQRKHRIKTRVVGTPVRRRVGTRRATTTTTTTTTTVKPVPRQN